MTDKNGIKIISEKDFHKEFKQENYANRKRKFRDTVKTVSQKSKNFNTFIKTAFLKPGELITEVD